jgi:hypothetical protein
MINSKMVHKLLGCDLLAPGVGLQYNNKNSYVTPFGGILTIILTLMAISLLAIFADDILFRKNYTVSAERYFNKTARVDLTGALIIVTFRDQITYKPLRDVEKYVSLEGFVSDISGMFGFKRCTLVDGFDIDVKIFGQSFCLTFPEAVGRNNTNVVLKSDPKNINFLAINVQKCNNTLNDTTCESDENILEFLDSGFLELTVFEDSDLFEKKTIANRNLIALSSKISQVGFIKLKSLEVFKDDYLVFGIEDEFKKAFTIESLSTSIRSNGSALTIYITLTNTVDKFLIKYPKFQSILTNVFFLLLPIYYLFKFLTNIYVNTCISFNIFEELFSIHIKTVETSKQDIIVHRSLKIKPTNHSKFRPNANASIEAFDTCSKRTIQPSKADYINSLCRNKSFYNRNQYSNLFKLVNNKLDFLNIIRGVQKVERLSSLLLNRQQRSHLAEKHVIFAQWDNSFECIEKKECIQGNVSNTIIIPEPRGRESSIKSVLNVNII